MNNSVNRDDGFSPEQIDQINEKLSQKGITTKARELIDNAPLLIFSARNPKKFLNDVLN
ncbi:MAG: hypothetical protein Q8P20_02390 [bacterium]|nr:hypothetical protein [bacterium]